MFIFDQFQFRASVVDTGEEGYIGYTEVFVTVNRNYGLGPAFERSPYRRTVHESFPTGDIIEEVQAADIDGVLTYLSVIRNCLYFLTSLQYLIFVFSLDIQVVIAEMFINYL